MTNKSLQVVMIKMMMKEGRMMMRMMMIKEGMMVIKMMIKEGMMVIILVTFLRRRKRWMV